MIHLQHDDTVAMSQQVRVHRLKISIQEDVLFLLAMSQQVRVHRLKINIQEDVLLLLAMSQQVSSSINKTDRHDITEILLKVALNTITLTFQ
jgi:Holliday junction resolvase RusA-like endonuclease